MTIENTQSFGIRFFAVLAALLVVASAFSAFVFEAKADHDPFGGAEQSSVQICHVTPGNTVTNSPSISGTGNNPSIQGHENHDNDIIPPFHYSDGEYAGKNWTEANEIIWNSGSCDGVVVEGCTDADADNYNAGANLDDGSCEYTVTTTFDLMKKFSGAYPEGMTADQFTFVIDGGDEIALTGSKDDEAVSTVELEAGEYTIEEVGPAGFVPSEWTVQWSGAGCEDVQADSTTITIEESDIGLSNFGCRADNIWMYGTVNITKVIIVDGEEVDYDEHGETFEFTLYQNSVERASGAFDEDGEAQVLAGIGNYEIVEDDYGAYTTEYSEGCSGTMEENDVIECVITNTQVEEVVPGCTDPLATNYNALANSDDGSCEYPNTEDYGCTDPEANNYDENALFDNGSCTYDVYGCMDAGATNYNPDANIADDSCQYAEEPTYLVFGYVWHDENENDEWDGYEQEEPDYLEDELAGWTVEITNGSTTYSTTTDETGYYFFYVPAGTWTITEVGQEEWSQTFPNDNAGHVVEVIDEEMLITEVPTQSIFALIMSELIPTAHAQTPTTYGPFNFGNVAADTTTTGGGGSSTGGGGGSAAPLCQEFTAVRSGNEVVLTWDTTRGTEMMIEVDGTEIYATTDNATTEEGSINVNYTGDVTYVLTVSRGSRSDDCEATIDSDGRGGVPTPQVLGEQVSVVPVGAPNTGAGGALPLNIPTPSPYVAALAIMAPRRHG